jgi:hypothetical protein
MGPPITIAVQLGGGPSRWLVAGPPQPPDGISLLLAEDSGPVSESSNALVALINSRSWNMSTKTEISMESITIRYVGETREEFEISSLYNLHALPVVVVIHSDWFMLVGSWYV